MNIDSLVPNLINEEENDKNTPLSDEELSRLIQASREDEFKAKEIKSDTSENFKKVSLHDIAKKYNQSIESENKENINEDANVDSKNDINKSDQKDKYEKEKQENTNNEKKENTNEEKQELENKKDNEVGKENNEDLKEEINQEKNIVEAEHLKILESSKKEAFEKGKETAYLEIKEGADAAIAKLNSISNKIAQTDKLDLSELENLISNKIIDLSTELTGKIIKAIPTEFLKKIKGFLSTLDNNEGKIKIFICEDDYKILEKNKDVKNKIKEMNISHKPDLLQGEVEMAVNGIRIKQKLES